MESLSTNLDLFVALKSNNTSFDHEVLYGIIITRLGDRLSNEDRVTLKEFCRRFTRAVVTRWKKCGRNTDTFRSQYENWLQTNVDWPSCMQADLDTQERIDVSATISSPEQSTSTSSCANLVSPEPSTSISCGTMTKRSRKPFEDLGTKQKKRRSDDHIGEDANELAFSAVSRFKEDGQDDIASVIEYMLKNPEAASKIKEIIKKPRQTFSPEKALGLLLSVKLSKWQYITLREAAIREGAKDIYPSYYKVQQAKLMCYPAKHSITVTDSSARVTLQALLDITVKRILDSLPDKIENKVLKLVSKWGFDGASNQSRYKQKMDGEQSDESIFMTSLVPLKLTAGDEIIWTNPKPCSALYCRPVQFTFEKESKAVVLKHNMQMDEEIRALIPSSCNNNTVSHQLMMTMVDAKICTYLAGEQGSQYKLSNASCYLCLAKPSEMNRLDSVTSRTVSTDIYKYGLSTLHARINFMECLLHISYRLDFKEWAARGEDRKTMLETRKRIIQDKFKDELNLLIDVVKQGSGTTNDGNTARRFFEFPDKTAAIIGLDEELVRRFAVIIQAITSGEKINIDKFKDYTYKTAEKYVELYGWYYMSSTVHKVLIHGADVIANNDIVPIGSLSEEASEARNKDFRRFREHNSRKKSRQASNEDIFNILLLSSDPMITAQRPKLQANKKQAFFTETLDLFQYPHTQSEFLDVSNLDTDSEFESDFSDDEN